MSLTTTACSILLLSFCAGTMVHAQSSASVNTLTTTPTTYSRRPEWTGSWRLGLGGESFREGRDEGLAAYVRLSSHFNYKFNGWLKAKIDPRLKFYSSRVQQRYDDDIYRGGLRARNAYLSATPTPWFEARAGAFAENFIDNPALISRRRVFPGVMEMFSVEPVEGVRGQLILQQSIPTSSSLNAEREGKEPLPIFQTQSVHVRGRNVYWLDYDANLGHYSYSQMPDGVAFKSAVMGNSVPGAQAAAGSRFMYGFDGFFGGGEVLAGEGPVRVKAEYRVVHNRLAPSDSADAQYWLLGPHLKLGDQVLKVVYGQYFVESDATVAQYNTPELGYNNRVGDIVLSRLEFPKQGFALKLEWTNSRVIAPQFTQQSMTTFLFGVETDYASF